MSLVSIFSMISTRVAPILSSGRAARHMSSAKHKSCDLILVREEKRLSIVSTPYIWGVGAGGKGIEPLLAAPHHKQIPPDIKHHRIPAPSLSFSRPKFEFLIEEIQSYYLSTKTG